jgi:hypothetical protein
MRKQDTDGEWNKTVVVSLLSQVEVEPANQTGELRQYISIPAATT